MGPTDGVKMYGDGSAASVAGRWEIPGIGCVFLVKSTRVPDFLVPLADVRLGLGSDQALVSQSPALQYKIHM